MVGGEVFPEGGCHEGLEDFAVGEEAEDFGGGEDVDADVFGGIEALGRDGTDACGEVGVGEVVGGGGVGG